jgi:hypothetical protein
MENYRFVLLLTDGTTVEGTASAYNRVLEQHGLTKEQARPLECWDMSGNLIWSYRAEYAAEAALTRAERDGVDPGLWDHHTQAENDRAQTRRDMTDELNTIALTQHDPAEGWGHALLFGTDLDAGWTLECDMQDGAVTAAFTPAGTDPLFLMTVKGPPAHGTQRSHIVITVERDDVEWDPIARTLTIRDDQ